MRQISHATTLGSLNDMDSTMYPRKQSITERLRMSAFTLLVLLGCGSTGPMAGIDVDVTYVPSSPGTIQTLIDDVAWTQVTVLTNGDPTNPNSVSYYADVCDADVPPGTYNVKIIFTPSIPGATPTELYNEDVELSAEMTFEIEETWIDDGENLDEGLSL